MLQQELARQGQALFRPRGNYLYVVIGLGAVVAFATRQLGPFQDAVANRVWFWLSLLVALAGLGVRLMTHAYAAFGTSGRVKDAAVAAELNTTGLYSLVRNPLYLGRILNFTGLAMLTGSWGYGAVVFFTSILVYERISAYEEEYLIGKFGAAWHAWAAEVPALLPRLHGWVRPRYRFWFRRMVWREYRKVVLLALALVLYDFCRRELRLPEDLTWYYAFGALCVVRLGFFVAKKRGAFRDLQ